MHKCPRNFKSSHLSAGEITYFAAKPVSKAHPGQGLVRTHPCVVPIYAVQRGMIEQVLGDGEIEVQRARLKHHAHALQRLAGLALDIVVENTDTAGLYAE